MRMCTKAELEWAAEESLTRDLAAVVGIAAARALMAGAAVDVEVDPADEPRIRELMTHVSAHIRRSRARSRNWGAA